VLRAELAVAVRLTHRVVAVGAAGRTVLPAVPDQQHVKRVDQLVGHQLVERVVCRLIRRRLRHQPEPLGDALDVGVDRHRRLPEVEVQHDARGFRSHTLDLQQPVLRVVGRHRVEERQRVRPTRFLADRGQCALDPRGLLVGEPRHADRLLQLLVVGRFDRREVVVPIEQRPSGSTRVRVGNVLRENGRHQLPDPSPGSAVGSAPCSATRSTGSYSDTKSSWSSRTRDSVHACVDITDSMGGADLRATTGADRERFDPPFRATF